MFNRIREAGSVRLKLEDTEDWNLIGGKRVRDLKTAVGSPQESS